MLIAKASPAQILEWFHKSGDASEVLCVFLPTRSEDKEFIRSIISNFYILDTAMKKNISFLLLANSNPSLLKVPTEEGDYLFPGIGIGGHFSKEDEKNMIVRSVRDIHGFSNKYEYEERDLKAIQENIIRDTFVFAQNFKEFYGLDTDKTSLCIFVRGIVNGEIIEINKHASVEDLLNFIQRLGRIVAKTPSTYMPDFYDLDRYLRMHAALQGQIDKNIIKLANNFDRVIAKYSSENKADTDLVAKFIINNRFDKDAVNNLMLELSFGDKISLNTSSRGKNVRFLCRNINQNIISKNLLLNSIERSQTVSQKLIAHRIRANKIEESFLDLKKIGIHCRKTPDTLGLFTSIQRTAERINLTADLYQKAESLYHWIKTLH